MGKRACRGRRGPEEDQSVSLLIVPVRVGLEAAAAVTAVQEFLRVLSTEVAKHELGLNADGDPVQLLAEIRLGSLAVAQVQPRMGTKRLRRTLTEAIHDSTVAIKCRHYAVPTGASRVIADAPPGRQPSRCPSGRIWLWWAFRYQHRRDCSGSRKSEGSLRRSGNSGNRQGFCLSKDSRHSVVWSPHHARSDRSTRH